ncbi:MAG: hypothetical protein WD768_10245 [Phycisphaeraceae bacterium]
MAALVVRTHFDHPMGPLPDRGVIRFTLKPLANVMNVQPGNLPGTLPVFITLCRQWPGTSAPHLPIPPE